MANEYRNKNTSHNKILIASTANPFKFAGSVLKALEYDKVDGFTSEWDKIRELERISGKKLPETARDIENAKVIHKDICAKDEMKALVKEKILK